MLNALTKLFFRLMFGRTVDDSLRAEVLDYYRGGAGGVPRVDCAVGAASVLRVDAYLVLYVVEEFARNGQLIRSARQFLEPEPGEDDIRSPYVRYELPRPS